MKAILEFNLPEESAEYEDAMKGSKYKCILADLDDYLRRRTKYTENITEQEEKIYNEIRTTLTEIEQEHT